MSIFSLNVSTRWIFLQLQDLPKDQGYIRQDESELTKLLHVKFPLLSKCLRELQRRGYVKKDQQGFYFPEERRKNWVLREEIRMTAERIKK